MSSSSSSSSEEATIGGGITSMAMDMVHMATLSSTITMTMNDSNNNNYNSTIDAINAIEIPQWLIDVHYFRKRIFLRVVEPIIVFLLGPADADAGAELGYEFDATTTNALADDPITSMSMQQHQLHHSADTSSSNHRRLSFLPSYVEDVNYLRANSMSFATLAMMYFIMSIILLVFLSCFYHNQKTSPLFVSPRRHRLPKLVPPPLPVDGAFSWVKICLFISDEEVSKSDIYCWRLEGSLPEILSFVTSYCMLYSCTHLNLISLYNTTGQCINTWP